MTREDVLTIHMRRFVAPRSGDVAGLACGRVFGDVALAVAGRRLPPGPGTAAAADGPVGGWGGDCVARRGAAGVCGRAPDGAAEGVDGDSPGAGRGSCQGRPVRCLVAGRNLGRGSGGVGLGMAGAVAGAVTGAAVILGG
jgi:hypothetical protein